MEHPEPLPENFLKRLQELEETYLQHDEPLRQSGYGGTYANWRARREPMLEAVEC